MTHPAFDLTVEPWLPVVGPESTRLVSLREALTGAHEIDALDHANPLVAAALHRMLTAVAVDLLPPLRSRRHWQDAFDEGRFDAESVGRYLDKDADRLDLFHPRTPFMQVAGLEAVSGEWKSVSLLLPEVATGNNVPLFSAVNESSVPPLTPAQAAQRLVSTHAWARRRSRPAPRAIRRSPAAKRPATTPAPPDRWASSFRWGATSSRRSSSAAS